MKKTVIRICLLLCDALLMLLTRVKNLKAEFF